MQRAGDDRRFCKGPSGGSRLRVERATSRSHVELSHREQKVADRSSMVASFLTTSIGGPMSKSPVLILPAILGEVVVWGDDTNHQITSRPPGAGFTRVAPGGGAQGLALGPKGKLKVWGGFGLGTPTMPIVPDPLTFPAGETYVDMAIGVSFAAAIRASNHWIDTSGVFAAPLNAVPALPAKYAGMRFIAVTVGGSHGLAIVEDEGTLLQWGAGEGTEPKPRHGKSPKYIKFVEVRARNDYSIALDELGDLYGWGGQSLFRPDVISAGPHPLAGTGWQFVSTDAPPAKGTVPATLVPNGYWFHKGPFTAIAAGGTPKTTPPSLPHVLALEPNGSVVGWLATSPAVIAPTGIQFSAIAAGQGFSIGLDREGMLHHWGQPGAIAANGKGVLENVPVGPFVSIGAGTRHASAVRPGGMSV